MNSFIYCNTNTFAKIDNTNNYITAKNIARVENGEFFEFFFEHTLDNSFVNIKYPHISKNIKLIDIYDDILIIPTPKIKVRSVEGIMFESSLSFMGEQLHFSVVCGGEPKLMISGFYKNLEIPLSIIPTSLEVFPHNSLPFVVCVLKGSKQAVIAIELNDFKCVFQKQCDSVEIKDYITLTNTHSDILKHTTVDSWRLGSPFELESRTVTRSVNVINKELFPYAFLEEVRLGGDFERFLDDNLKAKASLIPEFLQDFKLALPPLSLDFPNTITLVYENKIKYLTIKGEELISDICIEDYPNN